MHQRTKIFCQIDDFCNSLDFKKIMMLVNKRSFNLAIFIFLFVTTYFFVQPAEDAFILYSYSKNLATRGIITYGVENLPIEGATDFLYMVSIAALYKLGLNEFISSLIFNLIGLIIILNLCLKLNVPLLLTTIAVLFTSYFYSSLEGFSTIIFSSVYYLCVYFALINNRKFYLSILVLCLIRPDGFIWMVGSFLLKIAHNKQLDIKTEGSRLILIFITPCFIYSIWRIWYFGEYLPLPFIVKGAGVRDLIIFYKDSLVAVLLVFTPIIISSCFANDKKYVLKNSLILFMLPVIFYSVMSLEQNIGNRFLAPMFFGWLAFLATQRIISAMHVFIGLSILMSFPCTLNTIFHAVDSKFENSYFFALDLNKIKEKGHMLTTEAGKLAYFSKWKTDDSWGLNTPKYAHHLINFDSLERKHYDLVIARCELDKFKKSRKIEQHLFRSWEKQCDIILSYLQSSNYDIFLFPVTSRETIGSKIRDYLGISKVKGLIRHDIYAVSRNYKSNDKIEGLLVKKYGASRY